MSRAVSIVICTYNREVFLEEALESLQRQTAAPELFEVIVVNNNSTDRTQVIAERFARACPNFRVLAEPRVGLSHARNRGWRMAQADWVAYMDDDAVAYPDFVEHMVATTREQDWDCFGGVFLPVYKDPKPVWYLDEYNANEDKLAAAGPLPDHLFAEGMNVVFRKSALEAVGGFSPTVGMTGKRVAYGEETLVQRRIRQRGGTVGFQPAMRVDHYVLSYKLNLWWFLRSSYAIGRDTWEFFETRPTVLAAARRLAMAMALPWLKLPGALRRLRNPDYRIQNLLVDCLTQASESLGMGLEGFRVLLAAKLTVGHPTRSS